MSTQDEPLLRPVESDANILRMPVRIDTIDGYPKFYNKDHIVMEAGTGKLIPRGPNLELSKSERQKIYDHFKHIYEYDLDAIPQDRDERDKALADVFWLTAPEGLINTQRENILTQTKKGRFSDWIGIIADNSQPINLDNISTLPKDQYNSTMNDLFREKRVRLDFDSATKWAAYRMTAISLGYDFKKTQVTLPGSSPQELMLQADLIKSE